jgi:T5SS/PEP-CTERM-associated repeat protein
MFRPLLISLCLTSTTIADIWTVDDDGKADFNNIQAAVDAASDGDEIIVMPGTYTGEGDEVVNILGKSLSIIGTGEPEATIIDGEDSRRVFYCQSDSIFNVWLEGFTIQRGRNTFGGGLYSENANLNLSDCLVINNNAYRTSEGGGDGGGILCQSGTLTADTCTFSYNRYSANGGGIRLVTATTSGNITNCIFSENTQSGNEWGGGGAIFADGEIYIENCTFLNNSTMKQGGGVCLNATASGLILNSTFESNEAYGGGGTGGNGGKFGHGGAVFSNHSASVTNCSFTNNVARASGGAFSGRGTLQYCTFTGNNAAVGGAVGGAPPTAPPTIIQECLFDNNSAGTEVVWGGWGGAVYTGGLIENCVFVNNYGHNANTWSLGGAVYSNAATINNSMFCSNYAQTENNIYGSYESNIDNYFYENCNDTPSVSEWINPNGGSFEFFGSWFPLYIPVSTDDVLFTLPNEYTVTFDQDHINKTLHVLDGNVTVDIGNNFYDLVGFNEPGLIVGEDTNATNTEVLLTIQGGSTSCISTVIAKNIGSKGSLTLQGNSTYLLAEQELIVGNSGEGKLNLLDGAYLVSRNGTIGAHPGSYGTVNLQGEGTTWELPFFLTIDHGTVEVGAGASLQPGYFFALFGDGHLGGDGSITSDILNFGEITPGDFNSRTGTLFVDGDYEQVGEIPVLGSGSGTLQCNLTKTGHSELYVTGTAILGGGLIANLSDTFDPAADTSFRLLSANEVIDQFDVVLMPGLSEGKYMNLAYDEVGLRTGSSGIDIVVDTFANLLGFDDPDNVPIAGSPTSMTIADFNNDSFDDIAVTLAGADENSPGNVLVLISDGLGGFLSTQQITVGSNPLSVTAGDFNNDSSIDIAVACESDNAINIVQNLANGDGTFDSSWSFNVGNSPRDIEAIDLNNDGMDDLVVVVSEDNAIELWHSSTPLGSPEFALGDTLGVGDDPHDIDPGDVNNDKDFIKFVITNYGDDTATVWEKNVGITSGTWTSNTITTGNLPTKVKQADLNADGFLDVVISNSGDGTASVILASDVGYLPQVQLPVGNSPASLSVVDFDNDGDNDIAIVADNEDGNRVVKVLRSDLNLTDYEQLIFASATELGVGESPAFIDHGDMDGNGQEELISVSETTAFRGENTAVVSMRKNTNATTCLGDINFDSEVDVSDLLILIGDWGICVDCISDLDGDGIVRVNDILILISNWGPCE